MDDNDNIRTGRSAKAIGARFRLTREVLGLKQGEFGLRANLQPNSYNQIETGRNFPSIHALYAFVDAYGLDMNWLLLGDTRGLPDDLREALERVVGVRNTP